MTAVTNRNDFSLAQTIEKILCKLEVVSTEGQSLIASSRKLTLLPA